MQERNLQEIIKQEYARCAADPVHFFKKYAIIQHPTKGKMHFNLYPFQEKALQEFQRNKYTIVLKGRQLGLSTLTAGFALWKMIFTDDYKVLVIATTQDVAKELVAKVQLMYEKLPIWIRTTAKEDVFNKLELTFKNGSSIKAVSSSEKSARSPSISLLIVDEAAFIDKMDEIWTAAQATLSCVDYNTLIVTDHGLVRIGDLCTNDMNYGFNDFKLNIVNKDGHNELSNSFYKSTESDVYEILFEDGNAITVTNNHPLMCDTGWVRCEDLKSGMRVKSIKNTQSFGSRIEYPAFKIRKDSNFLNDVSNEDLAYFYGLYVAEGHRGKRVKNPMIGITNTDKEIQSFLIKKFGFVLRDDRHLNVNHADLSQHMKYVGIDYATAHDKRIPAKILTASKPEQIEFLRGLFDGDGCVSKDCIKYTSVSKNLVLDLYSMLLNFGIRSCIRYEESSCDKSTVIHREDYIYRGYDLLIYGKNARKYLKDIGFRLSRKLNKMLIRENGDYIEVEKDIVKNLIVKSGYSLTQFKYSKVNVTRLLWRNSKAVTEYSLEKILESTDRSLPEWNHLNDVLNHHRNSKIFYNTIVSITHVGRRVTYDLKVPETNSFVANGLVNHNTGGGCILLSTPNGQGGLFHKIWVQATENFHDTLSQPFNPVKLSWRLHPERDEGWAETQKALLGARKFAQEHDCDFISSGHTVIEGEIIQWYKEMSVREPVEKRYSGDMWIWKFPDYTKSYIVSADVARGDGSDNSAFHVFEVESMEQVASYRAKIGTREYGNLLVSVATEYNQALLVIDNKNMGWDVVQVALDRGYKNLYYSYKNDPFFDENIHLRKNIDLRDKKDMIPGFTTGHKARMNMISKLEIYFREKSVIVYDSRTINELFVFLWINGKPQAQDGYNDDLIMAMCMAMYVRDTALRLRQAGIELTKKALTNMHRSVYTPQRAGENAWKMRLGGSRGEDDLRWLL